MHRRALRSMLSMLQRWRPAPPMRARRGYASIIIRIITALTCAIRTATRFALCATARLPRPPHRLSFSDSGSHMCAARRRGAPMTRFALALVLALVPFAAQAAEEPDLIFRKSTVFHLASPNDKLAT